MHGFEKMIKVAYKETCTSDSSLFTFSFIYNVRGIQKCIKMLSESEAEYFTGDTSIDIHYKNMPIQIYWKVNYRKIETFQTKNSNISAQNIGCGYSLELPRRGSSNEYPQSMFWAEISKIMYTPVNLSFTI